MKALKNYLTDWRFYYKLIFGLFFLSVLLYHLLSPLINNNIVITDAQKKESEHWEWFLIDKGDYLLNFFSFFTIQTNVLVIVWLIAAAIFHQQEGQANSRWLNHYLALAVTTFITITFLVFNTMLLPTLLDRKGFFFWFTNVVEHMIVPIVMIIYYLFGMKKENKAIFATKIYWKKYLGWYFLYPIIWLVVMLIRGEFRYQAGKVWAYQYFFINIHLTNYQGLPGWTWLIIATTVITFIVFGISTLYNLISYHQAQKINKK